MGLSENLPFQNTNVITTCGGYMEMWGGYSGMMRLFLVWGVILPVFENSVLGRPLLGPAITLVSMWRRKKVYIYILWILKVKGAKQEIDKVCFSGRQYFFCIFFFLIYHTLETDSSEI